MNVNDYYSQLNEPLSEDFIIEYYSNLLRNAMRDDIASMKKNNPNITNKEYKIMCNSVKYSNSGNIHKDKIVFEISITRTLKE